MKFIPVSTTKAKGSRLFRRGKSDASGITMIELLLTLSLMTMVGAVITNSMIGGLKIWQRSTRAVVEEDVVIMLEKISHDLRNSINFSLIKFKGTLTSISFATVLDVPVEGGSEDEKPEMMSQVGRIQYEYDSANKKLVRKVSDYKMALVGKSNVDREWSSSLRAVRFKYYYPQVKSSVIGFGSLTRDSLPAIILIEVDFLDQYGRVESMSKMVDIPLGDRSWAEDS